MYPKNNKTALAKQLSVERALEKLATYAFEQWLPHARENVLTELTAAATPLPADLAALTWSQGWWELALDGSLMYGTELIYAAEFFEASTALGAAAFVPEIPPAAMSSTAMAQYTREVVAESLGLHVERVVALDRQLSALPSIRSLQSSYLGGVRNRMVNTPEATFRDISKVVDKGIAAGKSPIEMRDEVDKHLTPSTGNWKNRAVTIARTESAGAMSSATIQAATLRNELLEEKLEQTWIATLDGKTRKEHWAADGQRVALGGKFTLGMFDVAFPGDPDAPAEMTANCRCRVAVLAADEKLPNEKDRHTERSATDSTVLNREGSQQDEIDRRAEEGNIRAREDPDGIGRVASITPNQEDPMTAAVTDVKLADKTEEEEKVEEDTTTEETTADDAEKETDDEKAAGDAEQFRTFTDATIAVLGTPTDDRRILASDIDMRFRAFPLPLMWTKQMSGGHYDAFTVGVIESAKVEGSKVVASGYLLNSPEADEAASQISHGVTGPSVDLGDADYKFTDVDGNEITEEMWDAAYETGDDLKIYDYVTSAKLMGATLVSTPAFGEVEISLDATRSGRDVSLAASLTAAAFTETSYPAAFFADPGFTGPTPMTMSADGRISGHLACFGTCHVGFTDKCVTVPRSNANYAHFHTAPPVLTETGERIQVGRLTANTGHATKRMTARAASDHYDNTGACFALVRMGEDEHGVWFSGVAAPGATEDQIRAGLSAPLSGDWRKVAGNLELVAALAVNTPGFPVVSQATDEADRPLTLVASLAPRAEKASKTVDPIQLAEQIVTRMRAADRRQAEARSIIAARSKSNIAMAKKIIAGVKVGK